MGSEVTEEDKKPAEDQESPLGKAVGYEEEEEEELTPEKRGKKRDSPEGGDGEEELGNGRRRRISSASSEGTTAERPSRERKTVERYSAVSPKKTSATKSLSIKQGSGTKLKDIPNVVFKLSKRKVDDNLQALHTLLFGRKSNVRKLKKNLFQFSGFVWPENEEKLRAKLKEKLDKYNKDKLVGFCELLDIHILKTSAKKEEITTKLLEFLESPHVTRDVILADQDKKNKKQRRRTKEEMSSNRATKKQIKSSDAEVKKRRQRPSKDEEEQEGEGGSTGTKDASSGEEGDSDSEEEREHVNSEDEDDKDEAGKPVGSKNGESEKEEISAEPKIKENASPVKKGSPGKSAKIPTKTKKASVPAEDEPEVAVDSKQGSTKQQTRKVSKPATKETAALVKEEDKKKSQRKGSSVDVSDSGPSSSSKPRKEDRKKVKVNEKPVPEDKKPRKKKEAKPGPKDTKKERGESTTDAGPSSEELHSVISNILKEVDFNTATLADILKQLGAHFKMNLMGRKAEVKDIIEDIINSMTEDEDGDEDGDEDEDALGGDKEEENREEDTSDRDGK